MTTRTATRKSFLCDVFTTALEGGIGYWSVAHEYHWAAAAEGIEQDLDGFYAIITDEEADPEQHVTLRIDADVIARGLRRIADGEVQISPDIRAQVMLLNATNGEDGDYDSTTADCVVQAGLFGEVVYG